MQSQLQRIRAARAAGVVLALIVTLPPASAQDADDGFTPIFDGQTLEGWRGYRQTEVPASWTVEDGAIKGNGQGPDLITREQFADYDFRFQWKIAPKGNSGVLYRVTEDEDQSYWTGPEYQILDDRAAGRRVNPTSAAAALYALYGADQKLLKPAGEFNEARIVVQGNHVQHWLNGEKVVDAQIGSEDWNKKVAASKFGQWPRFAKSRTGHIALQGHGSEVWFRNLRIKRLQAAGK